MSGPLPASALDGHCSAIDGNTLYVLSSNSFQSLPLKENATWSTLSMGQAVTGPACVRAVPGGDETQAALYVIGGTTSNATYQGLQKYTFYTQQWETITPTTQDMQNRTSHSAAFLNDTSSILVYAGSQPDSYSELSSQTFVIGTSSPFNIRSFTSKAPPASLPILLPWTSDTAVMVGGSTTNKEVWTFDPDNGGWNQTSTTLGETIPSGVKGTIIDGSDGSKVLEAYDMTASPNKVSQYVLLGAGGSTSSTGQTIGTSSSRKRKRDLTLQNWPSYNSSNAPSVTRTEYAVAQNPDGISVISGGNSGAPVNIFDEQQNSWVDNGLFFDGRADKNQVPLVTPTSTASSSSTSSTSTSSTTPSATGAALLDNGTTRSHMLKVLGITLGVLCGIAALFIIALLLLRWSKQKKRRNTTYIDEKGDRMSFQDRGASFMKEAGVSDMDVSRIPPNHRFMEQNSSHNSFAIMAGKFGKRQSRSGIPKIGGRGSTESTRHLVKPKKSDISKPVELDLWGYDKEAVVTEMPIMPPEPVVTPPVVDKKRSSGWSRYFAPNDGQVPSAYDPTQHNPSHHISAITNGSHYSDDSRPAMPSRIPSSMLVPPLDFGGGVSDEGQRFARVATGSPSFNNSAEDLARRGSSIDAARGQRAFIHGGERSHLGADDGTPDEEDASATASTRTYSTNSERYSSSDYFNQNGSSSASNWTPVSLSQNPPKPLTIVHTSSPNFDHAPRPPSSNYTASVYDHPRVLSRGTYGNSGFFPSGNRDATRPNSRGKSSSPFPAPPASSSRTDLLVPSGNTGPSLAVPSAGTNVFAQQDHGVGKENFDNGVGRESTMTVFPRGVPSSYYGDDDDGPRMTAKTSDMSWLRLDDQNRI